MVLVFPYESDLLGPASQAKQMIDEVYDKKQSVIISASRKVYPNSFQLKKNKKWVSFLLSTVFFLPFSSTKFINFHNLIGLKKNLKKIGTDKILSFDFSSTAYLLSFFTKDLYMVMPDCQYIRYQNRMNFLDYLRYFLFMFLEFRSSSSISKAFFVSKIDLERTNIKNKEFLPLICDFKFNKNTSSNRKGNLILGPLLNPISIQEVVSLYPDEDWSCIGLVSKTKENGISSYDYVDNYWEFIDKFERVVIIDPAQSTGMSNRMLGCLIRGYKIICNEIALRGFEISDNEKKQINHNLFLITPNNDTISNLRAEHNSNSIIAEFKKKLV